MSAQGVKKELKKLANHKRAGVMQRFFKTGPGQYGEGDVFIGVSVPDLRMVAKMFSDLGLGEIKMLLDSSVHEERLAALLILVQKYCRAPDEKIVKFYLDNTGSINNWDLVDSSAPYILGVHLLGGSRTLLYKLAKSENIWERRIAIVATLHFIRKGDYSETLRISELLLRDKHDLIHKAAGWMLREVGKRNLAVEEAFVSEHCKTMPRTMLRYAIERFPESKKRRYMES